MFKSNESIFLKKLFFAIVDLVALSYGEEICTITAGRSMLIMLDKHSSSALTAKKQKVIHLLFFNDTNLTFILNFSHTFSRESFFSVE